MPINYQALMDMQMSGDKQQRAIAEQASKNMTPEEFQQFFDFQQGANEKAGHNAQNRPDDTVMGMPPEAFAGGAAALPGLVGGMVKGGLSGAAGGLGDMALTGAKMYGVRKGSDMLGLPRELSDILMFATGLKGSGAARGAMGAAEFEAEVGAISAAEKAALAKQGYSPETISKIEQAAQQAKSAPIQAPSKPLSFGPKPPDVTRRSIGDASPMGNPAFEQSEQATDQAFREANTAGRIRRKQPNFSKDEFPPGADSKSSPEDYLAASNDSANSQVNDSAVSDVQRKIQDALKPKAKLRKPK